MAVFVRFEQELHVLCISGCQEIAHGLVVSISPIVMMMYDWVAAKVYVHV